MYGPTYWYLCHLFLVARTVGGEIEITFVVISWYSCVVKPRLEIQDLWVFVDLLAVSSAELTLARHRTTSAWKMCNAVVRRPCIPVRPPARASSTQGCWIILVMPAWAPVAHRPVIACRVVTCNEWSVLVVFSISQCLQSSDLRMQRTPSSILDCVHARSIF